MRHILGIVVTALVAAVLSAPAWGQGESPNEPDDRQPAPPAPPAKEQKTYVIPAPTGSRTGSSASIVNELPTEIRELYVRHLKVDRAEIGTLEVRYPVFRTERKRVGRRVTRQRRPYRTARIRFRVRTPAERQKVMDWVRGTILPMFQKQDARLGTLEQKFTELEKRIGVLEQDVTDLQGRVKHVEDVRLKKLDETDKMILAVLKRHGIDVIKEYRQPRKPPTRVSSAISVINRWPVDWKVTDRVLAGLAAGFILIFSLFRLGTIRAALAAGGVRRRNAIGVLAIAAVAMVLLGLFALGVLF